MSCTVFVLDPVQTWSAEFVYFHTESLHRSTAAYSGDSCTKVFFNLCFVDSSGVINEKKSPILVFMQRIQSEVSHKEVIFLFKLNKLNSVYTILKVKYIHIIFMFLSTGKFRQFGALPHTLMLMSNADR